MSIDARRENPAISNAAPRRVAILGSTGSIGTQALDVVERAFDEEGAPRFLVTALSAGGANLDLLARQAVSTRAAVIGIASGDPAELLKKIHELAPGYQPQIEAGPQAAATIAGLEADVVLNGITGSIGLAPTLSALKSGAILALANKESLIVGGQLVKDAAAPGQLVPVDSEHSAIAQCLRSGTEQEVEKLILTASGGPFRGRKRHELSRVTPAEALKHPTWDMGLMVTTNSATLVNKGLELIEAHLLFDVPLDRIEVVVHPQSVVHSMVQFIDGSTIAQASPPDMRLPIALGLAWPERVRGAAQPCDWSKATEWTFEPLDTAAFPAVELAKDAAKQGGTHPAVFNAANEEAVLAFHAGRIGFLDIVDTVEAILSEHSADSTLSLESVLEAETWARARAQERLTLQNSSEQQ
ncbi:1-deoxy-D-xylulose-5-phosphate reductoisomerase [Psychromicrobium silvestre]|uniref:1-deoxy-D-xylulose 5-phosphate reductoisomerase n=1 Tax=Psychromicrobium silvestre TaxID=1645614 RepID=A0A7Y9LW28_9MICC|nr:1-deoxy-D-xylulose-5-phosphate reductoisomerase [Psychromicrobium silvestre]NYE96683.1 1-deoxy-D-xylulose-5-phosphate reductoisomerase [Psychromicrobium silvestre]